MHELEAINKRFGITSIVDNNGNFVYISMDIKQAIQFGESIERVQCPSSRMNISTLWMESVEEKNSDEPITCSSLLHNPSRRVQTSSSLVSLRPVP